MTKRVSFPLEYIFGSVSILLFGLVSAAIIFQMVQSDREQEQLSRYSGGAGEVFVIDDVEDYYYFAESLKDSSSRLVNADVVLATDIKVDDAHRGAVIGSDEEGVCFSGYFDGGGHTVSGLRAEGECVGLFLQLRGCVRNLNIRDCEFKGRRAGGITGKLLAGGSIENCCSSVSALGEYAGSICGECRGTVENCLGEAEGPAVGLDEDAAMVRSVYTGKDVPAADILNENAGLLPVRRNMKSCKWEESEGQIRISGEVIPQISEISLDIFQGEIKSRISAFFSYPERRWMLILPKWAEEDEYKVLVMVSDGRSFYRTLGSGRWEVDLDGQSIPVEPVIYADVPTLMVDLYSGRQVSYLDRSKERKEMGELLSVSADGSDVLKMADVVMAGRGNDSFYAIKKGYSLKMKNKRSIAGMEAAKEYNLIAGYRDNSLFNYIFTRDLFRELDMEYAHEYSLVDLYVNGQPMGLYFLTEKMDISDTAFDLTDQKKETEAMNAKALSEYPVKEERNEKGKITKVYYDIPKEPEDVTGGYLMEITMEDYNEGDSRFMTDHGVIYSSKGDKYLGRRQMDYISTYFQDFENAVYSPEGFNDKGKYYTEYIDVDSFADQWILYETMVDYALDNSVYYYKDSEITGKDSKIHASFYWDAEHMLTTEDKLDAHFLMRLKENGAKCDYNTSNSGNFWVWLYLHEDFRQAVSRRWKEKFAPAYARALAGEVIDGKGKLGSIEWYKSRYTESYRMNDEMFYETDYRAKCDEVKERLGRRMKVLEDYFK